jgi:hypothetical protein
MQPDFWETDPRGNEAPHKGITLSAAIPIFLHDRHVIGCCLFLVNRWRHSNCRGLSKIWQCKTVIGECEWETTGLIQDHKWLHLKGKLRFTFLRISRLVGRFVLKHTYVYLCICLSLSQSDLAAKSTEPQRNTRSPEQENEFGLEQNLNPSPSGYRDSPD